MDFQSDITMPIYSDIGELVGSFLYVEYDQLHGFVAGQGHSLALSVSLGDPVFLTPIEIPRGVSHAILTQSPTGVNSRLIRCQPNEEESDETKR